MPELTQLLHLIEELPGYRRLADELQQPEGKPEVIVPDAAKPYLLAALYLKLRLPMLVVTAQPKSSKKLYEQLSFWCHPTQVRLLPEPDVLPYERIASDASTELERLQVLFTLAKSKAPLIVVSALALAWKTTPRSDFLDTYHTVNAGMNIEPLHLLSRWEAIGYRVEHIVEVPGTISHRGGIIDIYPVASALPARLEFFGNTVESIRLFDPATQRSQTRVSSIAIGPATELLTPHFPYQTEYTGILVW